MILALLLAAWNPQTEVKGPFSHLAHINKGVDVRQCTNCHGVGNDWRSTVAGRRDHQPCQNEACHAPLYRQKSQICLVCHVNNEPFRPNDLRHTKPTSVEWRMGVTPHPPHLARGVTCLTCHPSIFGGPNTVEDGHKACGQCHEAQTAKPTMSDCKSCHQWFQDPKATVAQKRPWSTGARFVHDQRHYVQCEFCHRAPATSADLTHPTMDQCARCHDAGQKAAKLKVTGFGCAKCHGGRPSAGRTQISPSEKIRTGGTEAQRLDGKSLSSEVPCSKPSGTTPRHDAAERRPFQKKVSASSRLPPSYSCGRADS